MAFNFDEIIDRRNTDSLKWNKYHDKDIIPLWVADTDFRSPPGIIKALHERVEHGIFGYEEIMPETKEVFIERIYKLYNWKIQPEWLVFLPGVKSGLYLSVLTLTDEKNGVVMQNPIYPPFRSAVSSANRKPMMVSSHLVNNRWSVDFSSIEPDMNGKEKMLMLCNPHNPVGTAYRLHELKKHLAFSQKHNLFVCSDEIHCDILLTSGIKHIPFASLSEDAALRSITLMAPSKTFNIAGLSTSVAIIANKQIRKRFEAQRDGLVPKPNLLGLAAATAAWRDGQPWLNEQLDYLRGNRSLLQEYIEGIPGLKLSGPEATYLAWIDARELCIADLQAFFERAGVGLTSGIEYGDGRFVRLNFGCTKALLDAALDRISRACTEHLEKLA